MEDLIGTEWILIEHPNAQKYLIGHRFKITNIRIEKIDPLLISQKTYQGTDLDSNTQRCYMGNLEAFTRVPPIKFNTNRFTILEDDNI